MCYKNNRMTKTLHTVLTRRERQIMDILYRRVRATAIEVMDDLLRKTQLFHRPYTTPSAEVRKDTFAR